MAVRVLLRSCIKRKRRVFSNVSYHTLFFAWTSVIVCCLLVEQAKQGGSSMAKSNPARTRVSRDVGIWLQPRPRVRTCDSCITCTSALGKFPEQSILIELPAWSGFLSAELSSTITPSLYIHLRHSVMMLINVFLKRYIMNITAFVIFSHHWECMRMTTSMSSGWQLS